MEVSFLMTDEEHAKLVRESWDAFVKNVGRARRAGLRIDIEGINLSHVISYTRDGDASWNGDVKITKYL